MTILQMGAKCKN